jgi:cation:H+ antiporter
MNELILKLSPFVIFFISLSFLIKSSDIFIDHSERLGKILSIPSFIIGATIVALGTSLPELATSIVSVLKSSPENDLTPIVLSNVIGSNISNVFLGIGLASGIKSIKLEKNLIDFDLPFLFISTAFLALFIYDGILTRGESASLLLLFAVFILSVFFNGGGTVHKEEDKKNKEKLSRDIKNIAKSTGFILLAALIISISSNYVISSLTDVSTTLGISKSVASMFFLALGTSLPEILLSCMMVRKGMYGMIVGNILGSNISNILGIVGIAGIIRPLNVSHDTFTIGVPFLLIATFYFTFTALDGKFRRWEGYAGVCCFIIFLLKLFNVA